MRTRSWASWLAYWTSWPVGSAWPASAGDWWGVASTNGAPGTAPTTGPTDPTAPTGPTGRTRGSGPGPGSNAASLIVTVSWTGSLAASFTVASRTGSFTASLIVTVSWTGSLAASFTVVAGYSAATPAMSPADSPERWPITTPTGSAWRATIVSWPL